MSNTKRVPVPPVVKPRTKKLSIVEPVPVQPIAQIKMEELLNELAPKKRFLARKTRS